MPSDDDERHDDAEHEHEQTSEPVGELEAECWMLHEHGSGDSATRKELACCDMFGRRFKREILDQKLGKFIDLFSNHGFTSPETTAPIMSMHTRFGAEPSSESRPRSCDVCRWPQKGSLKPLSSSASARP